MSPVIWVSLSLAGAVGAPARYLVDGLVQRRTGDGFPWGTLLVNASGSFLLGLLAGWVVQHDLHDSWKVVFGAGFCGAFTTFSTFSHQTVGLLQAGAFGAAVRNALGTLTVCGVAAALGVALAGA